jgi:hypothetical protein
MAATGKGGGVYASRAATVRRSSISSNTVSVDGGTDGASAMGGGVYSSSLGNEKLVVDRSTVAGDLLDATADSSDPGADGAGIYTTSPLTMTASTVSGNQAKATSVSGAPRSVGGGMELAAATDDDITNSTIARNHAAGIGGTARGWGGGLAALDSSLQLTNVTMAGNEAHVQGGDTTVAAGGLYVQYGTNATIAASILAKNSAVGSPNCGGILSSNDYNVIGDRTGCVFGSAPHDQVDVAQPRLDSLAANGGPTETMALLDGSPAIDAVPTANCLVVRDQRGVSRPQGPACDAGAYERKVA